MFIKVVQVCDNLFLNICENKTNKKTATAWINEVKIRLLSWFEMTMQWKRQSMVNTRDNRRREDQVSTDKGEKEVEKERGGVIRDARIMWFIVCQLTTKGQHTGTAELRTSWRRLIWVAEDRLKKAEASIIIWSQKVTNPNLKRCCVGGLQTSKMNNTKRYVMKSKLHFASWIFIDISLMKSG